MKTVQIISKGGRDRIHGKDIQILDDQGNDISGLCRRVEITLDCGDVNVAKLEMYATVEVDAFLEGVTILDRHCIHCEGNSIVETTPFGVPAKTYARGGCAARRESKVNADA